MQVKPFLVSLKMNHMIQATLSDGMLYILFRQYFTLYLSFVNDLMCENVCHDAH